MPCCLKTTISSPGNGGGVTPETTTSTIRGSTHPETTGSSHGNGGNKHP